MTDLPNPEPEPEKFHKHLLKQGIEWATDAWIGWDVRNRHYVNFNSISREKRQEIMDLFRQGHTIGKVGEILNMSSDVVASVIFLNIQDVPILRQVSL